MKQLEKKLQRWNGGVGGRPVSPGPRKRLALPQLSGDHLSTPIMGEAAKSESEGKNESEAKATPTKSDDHGGKAKQSTADNDRGEIEIPVHGAEEQAAWEYDSSEKAVEAVTIKKWMTRKRSARSLLATTGDKQDTESDQNVLTLFSPRSGRHLPAEAAAAADGGDSSEVDVLFDLGKGMERSGSADAVIDSASETRKSEAAAALIFQRTKSDDSGERAAVTTVDDTQGALWRRHMDRIGGRLDSRRASDGNLVLTKGRRRRRNTDGAMLTAAAAGVPTDDDDTSSVDSTGSASGNEAGGTRSGGFRLRRRRGSLGSEASASDTEGEEEWHDMLHSLGVTVLATKKLIKQKTKERRAKKEQKRRSGELREVEDLWGSTSSMGGGKREARGVEERLEDQHWIVFVNRNSGGKLGQRVMNRFLELLPNDQIFSLIDDKGPNRGFQRWLKTPHYRLVVCGGDGTANWVLTALDKLATEHSLAQKPPMGIIPLGTGNDLSRACGWGSSFTRCEKLPKVMRAMSRASSALFDRWQLSVTLLEEVEERRKAELAKDGTQEDYEEPHGCSASDAPTKADPQRQQRHVDESETKNENEEHGGFVVEEGTEHNEDEAEEVTQRQTLTEEIGDGDRSEIGQDEEMLREGMRAEPGEMEYIMNNYFSIGVDAEIVLRFHRMREHHKELFRNVLINKGWYYGMSARTAKNERKHFKNFRDFIQVKVWHGEHEETLRINDKKIKSLIVMNIPTYGGAKCWGREDSLHSNVYHLAHKRTSAFKYVAPAIGDGTLEIVGMRGVAHLGAIVTGVSEAIKLAQGTRVEILTKKEFPAHVDGEPWLLRPCRITIELLNQSRLLVHPDRNRVL